MFYPVSQELWDKSQRILDQNAVKNVYMRMDGSCSAEVFSLTRRDHIYAVGLEPDQSVICGCRGYISNQNICSHILAVIRWLEERQGIIYNVFDRRFKRGLRVSYIPTSLESFNKLMGIEKPFKIAGGLPRGIILGLTADAEVGKSILCLQLMFDMIAKTGRNALFINTEPGSGIGDIYMDYWGRVFSHRFEIEFPQIRELYFTEKKRRKEDRTRVKFKFDEYDSSAPVIFVANYSSADQILEMMGRRITLEIGNTGKITPVYNTDELLPVWKTGFGKFLEENNIGFLAFDSITEPINEFIGGLKNYPGRHEATNIWMKMLRDYVSYYKLISVSTHHETVMGFGQARKQTKEIKGGKSIRHSFKFNILMEGMNKAKNRPTGIKRLGAERHPFKPALGELIYLLLNEWGYHEIAGDPQYDVELRDQMIEAGLMEAPE